MTSGTDELRRMLDERGVEWWEATPCKTKWNSPIIGGPVAAREWNGEMVLDTGYIAVTPEQAIAATLGSCSCPNNCTDGERTETCKLDDFADVPFSVDYEIEGYDMDSGRDYATLAECSACGAYIIVPPEYHHVLTCDGDEVYQPYRFCPNCGRRIEQ